MRHCEDGTVHVAMPSGNAVCMRPCAELRALRYVLGSSRREAQTHRRRLLLERHDTSLASGRAHFLWAAARRGLGGRLCSRAGQVQHMKVDVEAVADVPRGGAVAENDAGHPVRGLVGLPAKTRTPFRSGSSLLLLRQGGAIGAHRSTPASGLVPGFPVLLNTELLTERFTAEMTWQSRFFEAPERRRKRSGCTCGEIPCR